MNTLVAARCAGAANALLPVLDRLRDRPGIKIRLIAERPALQLLRERGMPVEEVPAESGRKERFLRSLFEGSPPDALLLGTSLGASVEKDLLRIGKELGIPSLSVVDHWFNYRARFLEPGSREVTLPNRIALMDSRAVEGAVAEGLPRGILEVTGQPHLQSLAAGLGDAALREQADRLRSGWLQKSGRGGTLLLFCTEFCSDAARIGTPHDRGYTETDALEGISEALDLLGSKEAMNPMLIVKLHPKEPAGQFRLGPRLRRRGFLLAKEEPAWACLLAADLLIGMTSMLLLEAAVAGRPVISYQPSRARAVPFVGVETGIVPEARTVPELAALLAQALASPPRRNGATESPFIRGLLSGDAAARITDLLLEIGRND